MLITEHSVTTTATPERIWEFWSDVKTWHTWDRGLDSAALDGSFTAGTKGWLKPQKGPKVKLVLNEVRVNEFFHDTTHMPLAQIDFFHEMERSGTPQPLPSESRCTDRRPSCSRESSAPD